MIRSRSRWNAMRDGCSGSECTRPRESRLRMAYGASAAASRTSSAWRPGSMRTWSGWLAVRLDDDLDGRPDIAPDLNYDRIRPELLDRLLEQDPPSLDLESLRDEQPLDVEVRDGSEEPPLFPGACPHRQREALDLRGDAFGRLLL